MSLRESQLRLFVLFYDTEYEVIHILRNHQGEGVLNDYANAISALSNAEFDYGMGEDV